jgi:hypothetical protein
MMATTTVRAGSPSASSSRYARSTAMPATLSVSGSSRHHASGAESSEGRYSSSAGSTGEGDGEASVGAWAGGGPAGEGAEGGPEGAQAAAMKAARSRARGTGRKDK